MQWLDSLMLLTAHACDIICSISIITDSRHCTHAQATRKLTHAFAQLIGETSHESHLGTQIHAQPLGALVSCQYRTKNHHRPAVEEEQGRQNDGKLSDNSTCAAPSAHRWYAGLYVCVCVCVCVCVHICTHKDTYTLVYTHIYTHKHTHTLYISIYVHEYQIYVHVFMYTNTRTRTRTHTHTHTNIHSHTLTHSHADIHHFPYTDAPAATTRSTVCSSGVNGVQLDPT